MTRKTDLQTPEKIDRRSHKEPLATRRIEAREIDPASVIIGARRRPLSEALVQEKIQSFSEVGQTTPIMLRLHKGELHLIAGLHRLEAAKRLDWKMIRAEVWECSDAVANLMEMDDNLASSKLTVLDIALSLRDRKGLYLKAHPETARGAGGARAKHGKSLLTEIISFSGAASKQLGWSERHIRNLVRLGEQASELMDGRITWAEALRGTSAENHFVELREFFAKDVSDSARVKMLERLKDAENPARSVRHAFRTLDGQEAVRLPQDQRDYEYFKTLVGKMKPHVRAAALYWAATNIDARPEFLWAAEKAANANAPQAPEDLDAFPFPLPEGDA